MRYIKHILFVLVMVGIAFTGFSLAKTEPKQSTPQDAKYGSIVRLVRDGKTFCSGSVINKNLILTASHCVTFNTPFGAMISTEEIEIRDAYDQPVGVKAKVMRTRVQLDQAILYGNFSDFFIRSVITDVHVLNSETKNQQELLSCGYPFGGSLYCSNMVFKELYNFMWASNGLLLPGMSGGPVMLKDGSIVAVNVAVLHTDAEHQISIISPTYNLELLLEHGDE